MAKIKHTKNELKAQRDALRRFERYLPTLLLKKQQLQTEMRTLDQKLSAKTGEVEALRSDMASWVRLFSEPFDFQSCLTVTDIRISEGNIAGVNIPVLEGVDFSRQVPDLFESPLWVDDALAAVEQLTRLSVEQAVMERQYQLLKEELRTTTQRVNLFEKVKIPECREHIRVIRIFLGDQQTAAVARAKIAKGKAPKEVAA
ncbi:MAG TPA: V-type ATP synthase subunit D [Kiritimatiellia bacterium]|nr:V-type ATP synthase subunit D [Kiritimatiellia bacterium]HNR94166.1 V-type ATP synthase subunit D [Kiritimatiellia bacterium]HNS80180.1 V-type ATP synthase subunit D [Kiritimatiellia bacterium]HPA77376.1 V-type ATP synthase subunit D [Kiritimatiellia bacterium]HQQ03876.1 V-type ATP synthase subunit D [Kiritimatiellia bacterium]